ATAGSDALSTTPTVTVAEAQDGYVNKADLDDGGLTGATENAPNGSTVQLLTEDGTQVAETTVTDNAFTFAKANVPDGKYTIKVTTPAADGGKEVSTSQFTVDTTVTAPSLTTTGNDGDGSVTVGLPTDAKEGDKVKVTFTGEDDQPVSITYTKGENGWTTTDSVPTGVTLDGNTLTIGEDAVKDGSKVNAKSVDTAGNEAEADSATAGSDALSTTPTVTVAEAQDGYVNKADLDDGGLTGATENAPNGSTVQLLTEDGTQVAETTVTDNAFTFAKANVPDGKYTIKVTTPAADGGKEVSTS
ncbi:hypothetical protein CF595_11350, partial [Gallibacterium anatis]